MQTEKARGKLYVVSYDGITNLIIQAFCVFSRGNPRAFFSSAIEEAILS